MRTTHSFGVDFIIRKCKTNKTRALLYARINVDGERREISLKEHLATSDWIADKEMIKGRTVEVKALNEYIDDVRFKIKEKYRKLQDMETLITAEIVKQAYLGALTLLKGHKMVELLDYYKKTWKEKMKPGGFKNYKTTITYVKQFLAANYSTGNIYLSQVSMEMVTEFEYYIRNNSLHPHDSCLGNGIPKHIQRLKRILNWAKEIKWIKVNQIDEYSCPLKKSKRKKLPISELVTLENKVFTDETLQYVQDLFLYSCYSGLAFVNTMALDDSHFEWDTDGTIWCLLYRTKSEELCPVPLLASAARILNKYRQLRPAGETRAFPRITNQTVNRSLKIIQEACGLLTPLTFHVARHTFAKTVALKNGIPIETVQMMMGHAKISTTQIYADVDEEKIMADMSGLEDKLAKHREIVLAVQKLQHTQQQKELPGLKQLVDHI